MKPYVPELQVFISPDKKTEVHSPFGKNAFLVRKGGKKEEKFQWDERFYPAYVFSDPSSDKLIAIGGLGDAGIDLGLVKFYESKGLLSAIDLKKDIPDLEELSRKYRDASNFPWVSSIEITPESLQIWICDKVLATIALKGHQVVIGRPSQPPAWAKTSGQLSPETKKYQWQKENRD